MCVDIGMVAVDTNVLVRLLTGDNPSQLKTSMQLFATQDVFIAHTVLLETEWVLRAAYDLTPTDVVDAFRRLLGLRNVSVAQAQTVALAVDWHELGLDFADALHLALCQHLPTFTTFDGAFVKRAKTLGTCRVQKLS